MFLQLPKCAVSRLNGSRDPGKPVNNHVGNGRCSSLRSSTKCLENPVIRTIREDRSTVTWRNVFEDYVQQQVHFTGVIIIIEKPLERKA